ncbi:hypothetical protein [Spirosoma daeguense]
MLSVSNWGTCVTGFVTEPGDVVVFVPGDVVVEVLVPGDVVVAVPGDVLQGQTVVEEGGLVTVGPISAV